MLDNKSDLILPRIKCLKDYWAKPVKLKDYFYSLMEFLSSVFNFAVILFAC